MAHSSIPESGEDYERGGYVAYPDPLAEVHAYGYSTQSQPAHIHPTDPGEAHGMWEQSVGPWRSGLLPGPERPVQTETQRYDPTPLIGYSGGESSRPTTALSSPITPGNFFVSNFDLAVLSEPGSSSE